MRVLFCVVVLLYFVEFSDSRKAKISEVVKITDIKEWKKVLRTKKNVLTLFTKDSKITKYTKLLSVLDNVSVKIRELLLATLILIDCGDNIKLCKKLKVSTKPNILQHNNGEFNKVYDIKEREESMIVFLKDLIFIQALMSSLIIY